MNILGIIFALAAGVFFGIIGPITKTAYNLGAGVGLAIFLRYIVALLIVSPLIPRQQNLISTYKKILVIFFNHHCFYNAYNRFTNICYLY